MNHEIALSHHIALVVTGYHGRTSPPIVISALAFVQNRNGHLMTRFLDLAKSSMGNKVSLKQFDISFTVTCSPIVLIRPYKSLG